MVVNDFVFRLLRKNATLLGVPDMSSRWLERWPSAFGWAGNNCTLRGATGPAVSPAVATVGFRPFRIRSASQNAGKSTPATWSVGTTNEVNLGPRPQVQLPDPVIVPIVPSGPVGPFRPVRLKPRETLLDVVPRCAGGLLCVLCCCLKAVVQ